MLPQCCSPSLSLLTCRPGHILHNTRSLNLKNIQLSPSELVKVAKQSAGDISTPHIFSPQYVCHRNLSHGSNVNSRAIIQSCRLRIDNESDVSYVYTMSFIASPWDFPGVFGRIPSLKIRAIMEPSSWEIRELQTKLSYGYRFMDIMLPSL